MIHIIHSIILASILISGNISTQTETLNSKDSNAQKHIFTAELLIKDSKQDNKSSAVNCSDNNAGNSIILACSIEEKSKSNNIKTITKYIT